MVKQLNVLMVEDSESDAQMIARLLTLAGYELKYELVENATQLRAALEKQEAGKPCWELVISEFNLPEFDGYAALTLLKEMGMDIPFIVVSGTLGEETAVAMMRAGAHDYVMKDNLARLAPAVERELSQAEVRWEHKQVEAARRESDEKYRELVENLNDAIFAVNTDGIITYVSSSVRQLTGYEPEELIGQPYAWLVKPEDLQEIDRGFQETLENHVRVWEFRYRNMRGQIKWARTSTRPILDGEHVIGIRGLFSDITERKQAEEALRESEEKYCRLFENASLGIFQSTPEGKVISVNLAFAHMFGFDTPTEAQKSIQNVATDVFVDPNRRAEIISLMVGNPNLRAFENLYRRKDGSTFIGRLNSTPITDANGNLIRVEGIIEDITERKRVEEALRESEVRYRTLFEKASDGICFLSTDLAIVTVNESFARMHGYTIEEMKNVLMQSLDTPETSRQAPERLRQIMAGESIHFEVEHYHKDGHIFPLEVFASLISVGGQDLIQTFHRDSTERKRTEAALQDYYARLEAEVAARTQELSEAQVQLVQKEKLAVLGRLANGVGHELRNPLAVILNAVYYLKLVQPEAGEKIQQYYGILEQEAHTAEKIVTDLLDFARIKSVDRESAAISKLVGHVMERCPSPKSIAAALDLPADLPRVFIDPRQIEQVLTNLVLNAYQAMPEGGKLVIGGLLSVNSAQTYVAVSVCDTGVGIPPENMPKLFEPLFTTKAKGIGLGLAVGKKLVEANGGRIEVESEVGKGSTFTVYLPVKVGL